MPAHLRTEFLVLFWQRFMSMLLAPSLDSLERGAKLLRPCLAGDCITSAPSLLPVMGEAQEVEGLRFVPAFPRVAEVHNPRFLRMDGQPVTLEPHFHLLQESIGVVTAFAHHHEVVGVAD